MGTRATTTFVEDGKPLVTLYTQSDGYPSGHGEDLRAAIGHLKVVNGYTGDPNQANGIGCLAAQAVAKLKHGVGNLYIQGSHEREFYHYEIMIVGQLGVGGEGLPVRLEAYYDEQIYYNGLLSEFDGMVAEKNLYESEEC